MGDLVAVQAELASQGVGLAAISLDDAADSKALAAKLGVEFSLLSDPEGRVTAAYGVQMEGRELAVPATFVVRTDRTIAWAYVGDAVPDRPPVDVVRAELEKLR